MADKEEQTASPADEAAQEDGVQDDAVQEAAAAPQDDEAAAEASGDDTGAAGGGAEEEEEEVAVEGAAAVAAQAAVAEDVLEGEEGRNMRKERVGVVMSAKMEKTIVVSIERSKKHPMYQKYLTRTARKMVHDENDEAGEGDTVRIMETRPISKTKRWRLVEILERAA